MIFIVFFFLLNRQPPKSQPNPSPAASEVNKKHYLSCYLYCGWNRTTALARLADLPKMQFVLSPYDEAKLQSRLALANALEGQFLPETYFYSANQTDESILLRSHKALQKVLNEAWQNRAKDLPLKSPYEALILASIVEKETGHAPERPLIAGVFINRLKKRMRLQSDPTVIYGMGAAYDGNIRKKDLQTKTAYNTYRINGLPPTPIALASADAIRAVMNPAKTTALYFVAKGGGEHAFSNTLVEHNRAVRKYLLKPLGKWGAEEKWEKIELIAALNWRIASYSPV